MKKAFLLLIISVLCIQTNAQIAKKVNPFVGTDAHGHTYPGVVAPFGAVQLSPDTRLSGWDGCSGYHYSDSIIYGFSHTHLSGTGVEDLCDVLFTPTVHSSDYENDHNLKFSHANEQAYAGYYKVIGHNKSDICVELAALERLGYHHYTFSPQDTIALIINMKHRDQTLDWNLEIKDSKTVVGWRKSKSWNENQIVYFASSFSKNIIKHDLKDGKLYLFFGISNKKERVLDAKVALSSVNVEGALKNLSQKEYENLTWKDAKRLSVDNWERALSQIEVFGGTKEDQITFYTSLYHCMIVPNLYSDVDGKYRGMVSNKLDNGANINPIETTSNKYKRYTIFSLWDTYRAWNPLLTILRPDLCKDFAYTFLDYYKQTGELPMWELHSWETCCMIGVHGVSVLAEWMQKGIEMDNNLALNAMISTANMDKLGLPFFNNDGYISAEREHESVSKTVEFAYNMYCIAKTAKKLGKMDVYREYIERSQYYKNLFNPQNRFIQPKENGRFLPNFDPKQIDINYTEGNGWHYTFYVPQDVNTLIDLMGGDSGFEAKLDECFLSKETTTGRNQADVTGLIGQYAHGNEPSQHTAYLYNYVGKAYKTQELVRKILKTLYSDKPDGVCGNDDCGQMGAWYVLSAMGMYPVSPISGEYVIGSPLFDKVIVHLQNKKKFIINSKQGKNTMYINSIKMNNQPYTKSFITHNDIINGAELTIEMSEKPNYEFGFKENDRPKSRITDNIITPVPYLEYEGTGTFSGKMNLKVNYPNNDLSLKKTEYKTIDSTASITFVNENNGIKSKPVTTTFYSIPAGRNIKILTEYSPQYTAGGDNALIDQKEGSNNWRLGCWQGYWGNDVEAIIDLGSKKNINSVGGRFIQDQRAWIFMPLYVEYYISDDGENFTLLQKVDNTIDPKENGVIMRKFATDRPFSARYIKVKAVNRKTNPKWHLSPGEKSWLFTDEIEIN